MKNLLVKGILVIFIFLSYCLPLQAQPQDNEAILTVIDHKDGSNHEIRHKKKKPLVNDYYRHHKKLDATFEGFAIELTTSDFPLRRDYFLFDQFGQVYYDQVKNEGYSYCIIADFSSLSSIKTYLREVVLHRAPEARIIEYRKGNRKVIVTE